MSPDDEDLVRRMNDLRQVFRGDWVGALLVVLRSGGKQYRVLRDEMRSWSFEDPWTGRRRSLSNGELARTLGRMVQVGLLVRTEVAAQWQPAVFYELSEQARGLLAAIGPLLAWAGENAEFFARAQASRGGPGHGGVTPEYR